MMAPKFIVARMISSALKAVWPTLPGAFDRVVVSQQTVIVEARRQRLEVACVHQGSSSGVPYPILGGGGQWQVVSITGRKAISEAFSRLIGKLYLMLPGGRQTITYRQLELMLEFATRLVDPINEIERYGRKLKFTAIDATLMVECFQNDGSDGFGVREDVRETENQ
jgi:hypothetical protein